MQDHTHDKHGGWQCVWCPCNEAEEQAKVKNGQGKKEIDKCQKSAIKYNQ
jgi:hypothetical protein